MIMLDCLKLLCNNLNPTTTLLLPTSSTFSHQFQRRGTIKAKRRGIIRANVNLLPVDSWTEVTANVNVDLESLASQLFGLSVLPYFGFLYFITKSNSAPKLTLFGFYFLLVFVATTNSWTEVTANVNVDLESLASQLFGLSVLPYFGFLYFITKSNSAPKLTLFGFYFLLVFVAATIPTGIYAKVHYGTSLSNVDWLHDGAESFLILTNIFIVLGLRSAIRERKYVKESTNVISRIKEMDKSST